MTADVITAINEYKTVQNLVLMEGSYVDEYNSVKNHNQILFTTASSYDFTPINNDIKRIILPIGSNVNDDAKFVFSKDGKASSIKVVQACKNEAKTENSYTPSSTDIRLLEAGALNGVAHYRNSTINDAYYMKFYGNFNHDDFEFVQDINNDKFDFSGITYKPATEEEDIEATWGGLTFNKNQSGQYDKLYVLLPDFDKKPADALFKEIRTNNENRISIGHYYATGTYFTAWSQNNGDVEVLTSMLDAKSSIKKAKLSGNLCAKDIGNGTVKLTTDGHIEFDTDAIEGNSDNRDLTGNDTQCAFSSSLTELDLSDAMFAEGNKVYTEDITFSKLNILDTSTADVTVELPTNSAFTEIPAFCFSIDGSKMKEIHIPYNIEKIRTGAFYACNQLSLITTDDGQGEKINYGYDTKEEENEQGETVTVEDPTAGSFAFSANLKLIESYAFGSTYKVKDVYCLAKDAPECHMDAFSSRAYTGNNGYSPQGVITRKDYCNGGAWIAMLHFPVYDGNIYKDYDDYETRAVKRYTDVTRDYSIADADGTLDERGKLLYWPNQAEFLRAYTQARNGFLWKAWNTERTPHVYGFVLSPKGGYEVGQEEANGYFKDNNGTAESVFYDTTSAPDGTTPSDTKTYDKDYRGWHQFVLTTYGVSENPEEQFSFDITDNNWWTICLPFNMTKENLHEVFGNLNATADEDKYPDMRELISVTRNVGNRTITLNFGNNIVLTNENDEGTEEDDVILKAGHPYLIKPAVETGVNGPFKGNINSALTDTELEKLLKDNIVKVETIVENGTEDATYKYIFIGNFYKWYIPQYSYFLGWDSREGKPAFFYHDVMKTERLWNPYTAVIAPNWEEDDRKFIFPGEEGNRADETVHWRTNDTSYNSVLDDDSFPTSEGGYARPYSIVMDFDNSTVTGITEVDAEKKTDKTATRVYTLNGQYVGTSTESLPKGIYIVDGKKTIKY